MAAAGQYNEEELFGKLWKEKDYVHTKKSAENSARKHAPMFSKVATAVNIRCGGALGSRSVRKQIQALLHFAIGNQKMRINSNTFVPSTVALVISANVGSGKSIYHELFEDVVILLRDGTAVLEKQVYDSHQDLEELNPNFSQAEDISLMLSMSQRSKKKKRFKKRHMRRNPGTKEGCEKALENENRMLQLIAEGDD